MEDSAHKTGLLHLPPELLCAVTELFMEISFETHIHRNLQNLRLTCRQLRDAAYRPFAISFFRKRSHVISAFSINTLHDIISDPHFGPHVKELTLVVMRSKYTGYEHVSGLYGQLMEKVFIVAHSYGNNLAIGIEKLPGTAHGWFDVRDAEEKYPESYALARTLDAARRAGVSPPDFHVETGADSDHMENTIMNHLGSQDDQSFHFSLRSWHTKVMYDHRQKTLKLFNYGAAVQDHFSALIARVVETLPAQMVIAKVEVNGFWLAGSNELTTNVLRPLLPQLESFELCSIYRLPMGTLSSIMKSLAEAPKLTRFVFSPDPSYRYHYPGGARESLEYEGNDISSMLTDGAASLASKTTSWD